MRKFYLVLFAFCTLTLFAGNSFAQTREQIKAEKIKTIYKEKGDIDYNLFKFRAAAVMYLLADTTSIHVISQLGKSYKAYKDYAEAEHWFDKQAAFKDQPDQFMLDYAETLANNGKYKESSEWFAKYAAKFPNDKRAANLAKTYSQMHFFVQDSVNWNVSYPVFNTPKDEFSPMYFNRGLIFTSNRDMKWGISKTFGWNETPFTDLYLLEDTATIKTVRPSDYFNDSTYLIATKAKIQQMPKTINDNKVLGTITYPKTIAFLHLMADSTNISLLTKEINTSLHDGPMSASADLKTIFYNRNNYRTSDEEKKAAGIYKLNLYSASYVGGKFYNVKPFPYNSLNYSNAHPALTADGNTLYFVSDMPGGYGGKDLYYSLKEGDSWSTPVNMGPEINTEGDEAFPYVTTDGNTLYFASNGHTGLGGLDLFKVSLAKHAPVSAITNLGKPVNSSKDDFGFIIDLKTKSGYFSSNRYGSDDIFKFDYRPIVLKLEGKIMTAYLDGSKIAVPNATVTLTYGGKTETVMSDNIGNYAFSLTVNTPYTITAEKAGFTGPARGNVTTEGIKVSTTLKKDLELVSPPVIVATPPPAKKDDCVELRKTFNVDNIFYDLDKFFIRNDALPAMNKLLALMKAYPGLSVQVKSHTDSRASAAYNLKLSNNRAKAVIDWMAARGISRSRFSAEYFGKRKLVNDCGDFVDCGEDKHQINRRSEFYLFLNGKNVTMDCPEEVSAPAPKVKAEQAPDSDCAKFAKLFKVENIFYDLDKYAIRADALPAMNKLLILMKEYPQLRVQIKSHTDSRASAAYNMVLSNNRAKAVIAWMVARGIPASRFSSEYFGKRKTVNDCGDGVDCSEDEHQINRRSEFYLFLNGKNITMECGL